MKVRGPVHRGPRVAGCGQRRAAAAPDWPTGAGSSALAHRFAPASPLSLSTCTVYSKLYLPSVRPTHLVADTTRSARHRFRGCHISPTIMDHISIPSFALLRYGTVILRLRMEKFSGTFPESCHFADDTDSHSKGVKRVVHRVSRCEHCTRTRIVSQCSDCDSALVEKRRTYRTRPAKSRYVKVCAAVCLLLLVGGLAPTSAAPHLLARMERASDHENETWSNPCDIILSNVNSFQYTPKLAENVSKQAKYVLERAMQYKTHIANMHTYDSFESMFKDWSGTEWLRNHSWFKEEVLPRNKDLGTHASETELRDLMTPEKLDEILPVFTKAMKKLGASLQVVSTLMKENDPIERNLKPNLMSTSNDVRYLLCLTSEVLRARKLQMLPLPDSEIPKYKSHEGVIMDVFLIYRDTLNFLEYVDSFFSVMSKNVTEY
ncbi:hypothetical protein O0L34_g5428 [Tuta absoluta]|nr:hypothetical protein O0L34_g5428 [Tuta absoluta]